MPQVSCTITGSSRACLTDDPTPNMASFASIGKQKITEYFVKIYFSFILGTEDFK
jgi:hypothetical protein